MGGTNLTMFRLRGLAALIFRRIKGFTQEEIAPRLGMRNNKQVSAFEHGFDATPDGLDRFAREVGFEPVHQARTLELLEFLDRSADVPASQDPFAPSPQEMRAILAQSADVARLVERWRCGSLREAKILRARQTAALQWQGLEKCQPHQRLAFLDTAVEFHNFALAMLLMAESVACVGKDAAAARERAELALAVAYLVGSNRLLSHAFGYFGNALRVAGDLHEAEAALARADQLWRVADDDGGLLDPGRLLSFKASLRRAQRRLPEALNLLADAEPISREPGRIQLSLATVLEHLGRYEDALAALYRAEALLVEREPRDEFLLALSNGIVLCHLSRHAEASALAKHAAAIAAELGNPLDELRSLWLTARVAAGTGDPGRAITTFETVRHEFAAEGLDYDVALVTLELAAVLLDVRRLHEAAALSESLVTVFASKKIHREALAAITIAYTALRDSNADADLLRRIAAFLYRAQADQGLRFTLL